MRKQDVKSKSALIPKDKYLSLIEDVKCMKSMAKRESSQGYKHMEWYEVFSIQGTEKLIKPLTDDNQKVKLYVHSEEQFDIIYSTRVSIGHGGRDRMIRD